MTAMHQGYSRYQQMRRHKRKLKEKYAKSRWDYRENIKLLEAEEREKADRDDWFYRRGPKYLRNGGFMYWQDFSISGSRQYAKKYSDKRIRQRFREMLSKMDYEDVPAYHGKDHEKEFDYNWAVW